MKVDAILGIKDFKTVYKLVREARRRWREIGIEFDISLSDLNDIEDRYGRGDSDRCLQAVLEKWLREYPIMPTWNTLIEVLREDTVKEEGVAEDVEKHVKSYNQKTPAGGMIARWGGLKNYICDLPCKMGAFCTKIRFRVMHIAR